MCGATNRKGRSGKETPGLIMSGGGGAHLGQLLNLIGVQIKLLQGLLKAEDLLGHLFQAAVGVVQRGDGLLLTPQAAAWHQPPEQAPLARHAQALEGYGEDSHQQGWWRKGGTTVSSSPREPS